MIEVEFTRSTLRDTAEAYTPEAAILAARTMWDDDRAAHPYQGAERERRVVFIVDDSPVRVYKGRKP